MNQTNDPRGKKQTRAAASHGGRRTFCQQLSGQAPAAGTERAANGYFFFSCRRPRQLQVRDIRTCDQEHKPDRSEQNQQSETHVANLVIVQQKRLSVAIAEQFLKIAWKTLCDALV